MFIIYIVIGSVCGIIQSAVATCPAGTTSIIDPNGNNYRPDPITVIQTPYVEECFNGCNIYPTCHSFSWTSDATTPSSSSCRLYSDTTATQHQDDTIMCQPNEKMACPFGHEQVGDINSSPSGDPLLPAMNNICIDDCGDKCHEWNHDHSDNYCKSFTWTPVPFIASAFAGTCKIFGSNQVGSTPDTSQITCQPLQCADPENSIQIGNLNSNFDDDILQPQNKRTVEECSTSCNDNPECVAYSWQPVGGNLGHVGQKVCNLYGDWQSTTQLPVGSNQVLCKKQYCNIKTNGVEAGADLSGDPHFTMWNQAHHHFQGNYVLEEKLQFYLMSVCNQGTIDATHSRMPFSLLGQYYIYASSQPYPTSLDYTIIILYGQDGSQYYVFFSPDIRKWVQAYPYTGTFQPTTNYDKNTANGVTMTPYNDQNWNTIEIGGETAFRFKADENWAGSPVTLTLEINPDTDNKCTIRFRMQKHGSYNNGRYKMNYLRIYRPECYKCNICGQFGDFQHEMNVASLLGCDGQTEVNVAPISRWKPATSTNAFSGLGLSWEKTNVDDGCLPEASQVAAKSPKSGIISKQLKQGEKATERCSGKLKQKIIEMVQEAADESKTCCRNIGGSFCNDLRVGCIADICEVVPKLKEMSTMIQTSFTDIVSEECKSNTKFGPVPKLLYEFDGNLKETMSNGDPKYDLKAFGDAQVGDGVLYCDGSDDYAFSQEIFNFDISSYTLEILVQIDDISVSGSSISIFDKAKTKKRRKNGKYSRNADVNYNFDSIFFDADKLAWNIKSNNDKKSSLQQSITHEIDTSSDDFIQLIATFDSKHKRVTLFRNGAKQQQYAAKRGFIGSLPNEGYRMMFCGASPMAEYNFYGRIRYGVFYDYVLSEEDILRLYRSKIVSISGLDYPIEAIGNELRTGKTLQKAQALMSIDEEYIALMRKDGVFVIYDIDLERNIIDTLMEQQSVTGEYVKYNTDGSIFIYDDNDERVLQLAPSQSNPLACIMQSDGSLVALDDKENVYYNSNDQI